MRRSVLCKLAVAFALVLLLVLEIVPAVANVDRLLIGDGVDGFTGEDRAAAQHALGLAQVGCRDAPAERLRRRRLRVVDVQLDPGYCAQGLRVHRATLRAYTLFGIPTGRVSTTCGSVNCRS